MAKTPSIQFKRGDDFKLDLTVTDTNNVTAIAAASALETAQADYDAALAANPSVPQDIIDTLAILDATQTAYDDSIIVDITGWTIAGQMAWCGQFAANFTMTMIEPTLGTFSMTAGAVVTQTWEPREYEADVEFTRPEGKVSSQTFIIKVVKDIPNV